MKTPKMGIRLGSLTVEGEKTRVDTHAGASGVALDSTTPRVANSYICSSQTLGNKATRVRISARWALSADLRCLRLDPGDTLHRIMGALLGLLEVCFIRAMEWEVAVEGESNDGFRRGRQRRQGDDLGNFVETRSTPATVPPGEAYKASLARRCGPTVPLGAEAEEAV